MGPLRQLNAGIPDVVFAELGSSDGAPAILLHGWPSDTNGFIEVPAILGSALRWRDRRNPATIGKACRRAQNHTLAAGKAFG